LPVVDDSDYVPPYDTQLYQDNTEYVYVLQLQNDKWYVGYTRGISKRMHAHFTKGGAEFTKLYKPVKVHAIYDGGIELERTTTLKMMKELGWNNVRGSNWCQITDIPRPVELDTI
jgi:predicted GIY-YIG superfamily endonuclease